MPKPERTRADGPRGRQGRTLIALVHKRTGDLRACQSPLGHPKLESTLRHLGVEVDDALILSEQTDL